jgi:hypothetical protein
MISLRCIDYYYVFCIYVWCDVNFSLVPCLFVLWGVEEPVVEDSGVQQVEVAEQELIERQVLPLTTFIYPIIFFIIILSCIGLILMGPNRPP